MSRHEFLSVTPLILGDIRVSRHVLVIT